ncbi:MAG: glycosyltransferase family 4 protein [Anaerolineae bacterium]|jgi:glycosyltransferase involved in cell wall biosynthesis|nr:glycosyltransferase family 4 protein [Anaerolineae bacterium]
MRITAIEFSGKGAMPQYVYHLCQSLAEQGVTVELLTATTYELADLPHHFTVRPILPMWDPHRHQTRYRLLHNLRRIWRGIQFVFAWICAVWIVLRDKPDIVLLGIIRFSLERYFIAILKRFGVKLAAVVHDVRMFNHNPGASVTLDESRYVDTYRRIYQKFDALFVHDRINYELFLAMYQIPPDRVHEMALPPMTLLAEITPNLSAADLRAMYGLLDERPIVLFFGTINKYKGVENLIRAFPIIYQATDARLMIVGYAGKDAEPERLQQLAQEVGIGDQVIWHFGYVPNESVRAFMEVAEVAVYPYHHVTQSGALKIAYLFGKPVVATAVGGLPDVVENGQNGYLVSPDDDHALADAVIAILNDPEGAARMGAHNRYLTETRYSWATFSLKMIRALERLLPRTAHSTQPSDRPV